MWNGLLAVAVALLIYWGLLHRASVVIYEHQRGLKYVNGRLRSVLGPGRQWVFRPTTRVDVVDIRRSLLTVPGQEVLTRDRGSVKISLMAEYQVADPRRAFGQSADPHGALYSALQIALRQVVSTLGLDELLQDRDTVADQIRERVQPAAADLGLQLHSVAVRDLMLPADLKRAYAEVLRAQKEGLAVLERTRGETAALRNLANAARLLEEHPALLQLRLLQAVGQGNGHTLVLGGADRVVSAPRQAATADPQEEQKS